MGAIVEILFNICTFTAVVLFVLFTIYVIVTALSHKEKGWKTYQSSLEALRLDPTNADLKSRTLSLGRDYSKLAVAVGNKPYDEVALLNDINAASTVPANHQPIEARLAKLYALRTQGVITEEEYAEQRRNILDDI